MVRGGWSTSIALVVALTVAVPAFATNGYFEHGYGNSSKVMGGVAFALPQDTLVIATNPAGLSLISDRVDFGVDWFIPQRASEIEGNQTVATALNGRSANGEYDGNGRKNFYIPEGAYSHRLDDVFSVGIALYGNGGLNTDYQNNSFATFQIQGTPRNAGVDFAQFFVAPALSARLGERQSIGVAVNLIYQRFKATRLQAFALQGYPSPQLALVGPFSESPDDVTDNGYNNSFGIGYRLGYLVEPLKGLTFGLSGAPKIQMSRFDKYKGLFADHAASTCRLTSAAAARIAGVIGS